MTVKTAGGQWMPLVNRIMKSENVPKEIVKTFMDLVDMAKGLMDENQFNNRLFPNTRGRGRGSESREFHRVGAGESSTSTTTDTNIIFATPSTTKRTIAKIWESKT